MRRVAQRAVDSGVADRIVVASDHREVLDAVAGLPVDGRLTSPVHRSGTERVAEIARRPEYAWAEVLLNVQGDEPFFPLEGVVGALAEVGRGRPIGTVGGYLTPSSATDVHRVKVVVDGNGRALRFARTLPASAAWRCDVAVLEHVGLYAYTRDALAHWAAAPPDAAERTESLEQMRPLALGITIGVARLGGPPPQAIDTEQDLQRAEQVLDSLSVRVG